MCTNKQIKDLMLFSEILFHAVGKKLEKIKLCLKMKMKQFKGERVCLCVWGWMRGKPKGNFPKEKTFNT